MMFPKARKGVTKIFIAELFTLISGVLGGILYVIVTQAGGIDNFSFEGNNSSSQIVLICFIAAAAISRRQVTRNTSPALSSTRSSGSSSM